MINMLLCLHMLLALMLASLVKTGLKGGGGNQEYEVREAGNSDPLSPPQISFPINDSLF